MSFNSTAMKIQTAWLEGSDNDCNEIVNKLAEYLGVNPNRLYSALTNIYPIVSVTLIESLGEDKGENIIR